MRLLVFGYYGGRNFGDEMMLLGLLNGLETAGQKPEIQIINPTGEVPSHLQNRIHSAVPMKITQVIKALRKSDSFIICGGTMFHDAYPDQRHKGYRLVLAKLAVLCLLAKFFGNKVGMVGVGIGPFKRPFTKKIMKIASSAMHFLALRDKASYDDAHKLGLNSDFQQTHDLSLLASHASDGSQEKTQAPHIIFSIVPEKLVSSVDKDEIKDYLTELPKILSQQLEKFPTARVSVLVVNQGEYDGDTEISECFYDSLSDTLKARTKLIPFNGNPVDYLNIMQSADVIIGMRFHIAVVGTVINRPTIWIPYQRKVSDGAASLGVNEELVILPKGTKAAEQAVNRITSILRTKDAPMAQGLEKAKQAAFGNIDMLCDLIEAIDQPKSKKGREYLDDISIKPTPELAQERVKISRNGK